METLMSVVNKEVLTSTKTEKLVFLYEKVLNGVARKWRMTNTCSGRMVAVWYGLDRRQEMWKIISWTWDLGLDDRLLTDLVEKRESNVRLARRWRF